jgi:hypothetical protein
MTYSPEMPGRAATNAASEAMEKGQATADRTARAMEDSYAAFAGNFQQINLTLIEMMQKNANSYFELARTMATAKSPSDLLEQVVSHTNKQMQELGQQSQKLMSLGAQLEKDTTRPLARGARDVASKVGAPH